MIVIYTPKVTNRIQYIFDFVFKQYFGVDFIIESNVSTFLQNKYFKLNYSSENLKDIFSIYYDNLLLEEDVRVQKIFISKIGELPVLFPAEKNNTISFDIFASIFYLISRYEEYLPHEQDEHGRFLSTNSILFKSVFNFKPIVEIWLQYLQQEILKHNEYIIFKQHHFTKTYTFDIDHAFEFLGRNWFKNPPNIFKKEVRKVISKSTPDAFDTFQFIDNFCSSTKQNCIFFFLLNNDNKLNSNVSPNSKELHNIIQQLKKYTIGIHPSYYHSTTQILNEKQTLEKMTKETVRFSRQHFLRIHFPSYFQELLTSQIEKDFSLAYPNVSGCRAGTTQPFRFFDLSKNESTKLILQPFVFMDATYQYYQKIDQDSIAQQVEKLLEEIKKINGNFVSLFHNDLLQDKYVYKKILYLIKEY
jgi:hypothetical protein